MAVDRGYLKSEIKRVEDRLNKRINRILSKGMKTYATEKYSAVRAFKPNVRTATEAELKDYLLELRSIDTMKGSTVRGAKSRGQEFYKIQALRERADAKDIFKALDRALETNPVLRVRDFKYAVVDALQDATKYGSYENLGQEIMQIYDSVLLDLGGGATQNEMADEFGRRLSRLLR